MLLGWPTALSKKFRINGDWVELSTYEDVLLLAPEILTLLRVFLHMGDLFNCPKRKTRTSNSDSETNSPEGKRLCNE